MALQTSIVRPPVLPIKQFYDVERIGGTARLERADIEIDPATQQVTLDRREESLGNLQYDIWIALAEFDQRFGYQGDA